MFSNGVAHEKQKTFLMQICKIAQKTKILPIAAKFVEEYSRKWHDAGNLNEFVHELLVGRRCNNVINIPTLFLDLKFAKKMITINFRTFEECLQIPFEQ